MSSSSVDLRIELPTHSLSFHVQIPHSSTIRHLKEQIQSVCQGSPRVDGQRIIWSGRFLKDDEVLHDIWKSPADSPVVHLSVHPSAWTEVPPEAAGRQATAPEPQPQPEQPSVQRAIVTPGLNLDTTAIVYPVAGLPLPLVSYYHNVALHTLLHGKVPATDPDPSALAEARSFARSVLHANGMSWPIVLDTEYPPADTSIEGVKYEQVVIDNSPFLSLTTPNAIPSPCQSHALDVLRTTYALLSIPAPDLTHYPSPPSQAPYQGAPNTNLNHHLQQLGLPVLRLAPNQNANRNPADPNNPLVPEIRAIPLRALLVPLMMLTFRTVLLMYFFSPSKRPLFGLVISVWVLYETWNAFRMVLGNGERPGRNRDGAGDNVDPPGDVGLGAAQAPNAQQGAQAPAAGATASNRNASRSYITTLFDKFANFQLMKEELALVGDPTNSVPVPTLFHRVKTFCTLLVTTLHPAVWDRRRAYLRRREGRLRGEANLRTPETSDEEHSQSSEARHQLREHLNTRHERRPTWVKAYVERVLMTEWVDDL